MKKIILSISLALLALSGFSQCTELFFSEYVEGTYSNKALELYNPTGAAINLSAYRIVRHDNGNVSPAAIEFMQLPSVSIAAHSAYVIVINTSDSGTDTIPFTELSAKADTQLTTSCDPTTSLLRTMCFNGDDALVLEKNVGGTWTRIDIIGLVGERPTNGSGTFSPTGGWTASPNYYNGVGTYWTQDHTLIRKKTVMQGHTANGIPYNVPGDFNPSVQWDSLPQNTFDSLGTHTCNCPTTGILSIAGNGTSFEVYPNPLVNGELAISLVQPAAQVQIIGISGVSVAMLTNPQPGTLRFNLSDIAAGIYFARVSYTDGSWSAKKIIVN